jgi:aminopeptidase-like protein/aminoglycoside N3'-acetyltransferase
MKFHYNRAQMAQALKQGGLKRGDVVFSHSNVGYLGYPEEGQTSEALFHTILGAFFDVIGAEGTLVVPTFTYSFPRQQPFDPDHSPSTCGLFTEMLRRHPEAQRSADPIFSVAALGRWAQELTSDLPPECFGKDSFWDRFRRLDGVVCNVNFDAGSTFVHYVERCLNVPYRYDKLFTGWIVRGGKATKRSAIYFCQDLSNPDTVAAFEWFDRLARERGLVRSVPVGRGAIVVISAAHTFKLIESELKKNPWFLTVAGQHGKAPRIRPPESGKVSLNLPENASMEEMMASLYLLPRDIISDGYDLALQALAGQAPMKIHAYPTGTHCWTWIIPEKWTCREAYLETLDGEKLFSYDDHPLHVVSYSLPFEGEVSREELFQHLHVHPKNSAAIPFVFKYYDRDWGLCCPGNLKDSLKDERYRVLIDSHFSYGALKVGEIVAPGQMEESIVFCAHLCHPGMANDGLTGVVAGLEVMRALLQRWDLRYTYRFLIVPETIGSIAYLSHHEDLIPKMRGGLFLEALGLPYAHALQQSYAADTEFDRCCLAAVKEFDPQSWTGKFLTIVTNDERQFNAPGVRVPMLSLSRVARSHDASDDIYPQYHTNFDDLDAVSPERLRESVELILHLVDRWEANRVPVNRFKGEVFLSRFGITFDFIQDFGGSQALFDVMFMLDGRHSILDIAEHLNIPFSLAERIVSRFHEHGLVEYL